MALALAATTLALLAPQPAIVQDPVPYPTTRRRQMAAYSLRHYGFASHRLKPKVIVLHFTANNSYRSTWNTFASNAPARGERPGTCAHYVIAKDGRISQLVPLGIRCRHAIGLNHVSIGIEFIQEVGKGPRWAAQQILKRPRQVKAGLRLVRWLQDRYGIAADDVVGHATANDHPRFRDLQGWRNDHADWQAAVMERRGLAPTFHA
jgi:N-acetyl-anhydromuramyl-L-alanine amidase AmpD